MAKVDGLERSIETLGLIDSICGKRNVIELFNWSNSEFLETIQPSSKNDVISAFQLMHRNVSMWESNIRKIFFKYVNDTDKQIELCATLFRNFNELGVDYFDVDEDSFLKYEDVSSWTKYKSKAGDICFHNMSDIVSASVSRQFNDTLQYIPYTTTIYIVIPSLCKCDLVNCLNTLNGSISQLSKKIDQLLK